MAIRTSKYIDLKEQEAQIEVFVAEGLLVFTLTKKAEPANEESDEVVAITIGMTAADASDLQRALRSMARTLRLAAKGPKAKADDEPAAGV